MGSNSTNKFRKVPVFLFFIFYLTLSLRPAIGQITPRSPGRSAASGGPSLIIDRQPEVTTGDMLIAAISYSDDDPGNNLDIAATATGWTVIDDRVFSVSGDNEWRAALLYRVADGSESSTFTFNLDPDTDGAIGIITTYFGVDVTGGVKADGSPGGPFDADPANLTLFGSGSLNTPGITTTTGFALVIFQGFIAGASSVVNNSWSATNPASFSELYDLNTTLGADQTVAAATRERNTAGFTGIGTATTGTSAANASILFALKAIPVSPMAQLGCDGRFYLSYTNATGQYATTNMNRISFSGDIITETPFIVNPTNIPFNGIGLAPNTGFLQGFSNPISSIRSIRIGDYIPSGNLEIQGSFSHPQIAPADQVYAGCYDANNNLYFITSANKFFSNTSPTLIATLTPVSGPFIDIAVDPTDGQMYGTAGTGLTNKNLYKINTSTGALTLVDDYNNGSVEVIAGLLFDEEGHLFGYSSFGRFLQIDKTTAALTELGNSLQGYLDGDA